MRLITPTTIRKRKIKRNIKNSGRRRIKNKTNKKKKLGSVRFGKELVVEEYVIPAPSTPTSTWLSQNDYRSIQKDFVKVLNQAELQATERTSHYCARGLETHCRVPNQKTISYNADVIQRRQDRIRIVMAEQESQRLQTNSSGTFSYNDSKMRDVCLTQSNRLNALRAVELALCDSEAALAVYAEKCEK